jgi:hypothetical protein
MGFPGAIGVLGMNGPRHLEITAALVRYFFDKRRNAMDDSMPTYSEVRRVE